MNVGKSMIKVDLAKSLGSQYSDMVKVAERDEVLQQGAREALKLAVVRVGSLGLQLDRALEDGELSAADLKDPQKVETFIKRWNKRAVGVLDNLATTAEVARTLASGRAKGLRAAEEVVQKMARVEVERLTEIQRQIDSGELSVEEVHEREAPPSLKHQREDESAVSKPKTKTKPKTKPKTKSRSNTITKKSPAKKG